MGKSEKVNNYEDFDEKVENTKLYNLNKRKEKRIISALKSKNVNDLIALEDEDDF